MSQQFTSQRLSHQRLSPGAPEVSMTVLSWLGTIFAMGFREGKCRKAGREKLLCHGSPVCSEGGVVSLCLVSVALFSPKGDFSSPLALQGL